MWRRNRVHSTNASPRPRDCNACRRYINGGFLTALHQTPPSPPTAARPFRPQPPFPLATIKLEILKSVLAMAADAPASTSAPRSRRASTAGKADAPKPASKAAAKKAAAPKAKATKPATKKAPAAKASKAPAAHPSWKDMIKVCSVVVVGGQALMWPLGVHRLAQGRVSPGCLSLSDQEGLSILRQCWSSHCSRL